MSQTGSQVSSGNIAPTVGLHRGTKEVIVLVRIVHLLEGLFATVWLYSQSSDQEKVTLVMDRIEYANVPDLLRKATAVNQTEASTIHTIRVTTPVLSMLDIIHVDIYFEVGRKGLTGEGRA